MSERVKNAEQEYFKNFECSGLMIGERYWFSKGYEQAEKATIEKIIEYLKDTNDITKGKLMKWIEENWPNESGDNPRGIYVRRCY